MAVLLVVSPASCGYGTFLTLDRTGLHPFEASALLAVGVVATLSLLLLLRGRRYPGWRGLGGAFLCAGTWSLAFHGPSSVFG